MFAYIWPIALAVLSNIIYQICTKSVPKDMDPLASLTVTYLVSAAACGILYFVLNRGQERNLLKEYSRLGAFRARHRDHRAGSGIYICV